MTSTPTMVELTVCIYIFCSLWDVSWNTVTVQLRSCLSIILSTNHKLNGFMLEVHWKEWRKCRTDIFYFITAEVDSVCQYMMAFYLILSIV